MSSWTLFSLAFVDSFHLISLVSFIPVGLFVFLLSPLFSSDPFFERLDFSSKDSDASSIPELLVILPRV